MNSETSTVCLSLHKRKRIENTLVVNIEFYVLYEQPQPVDEEPLQKLWNKQSSCSCVFSNLRRHRRKFQDDIFNLFTSANFRSGKIKKKLKEGGLKKTAGAFKERQKKAQRSRKIYAD